MWILERCKSLRIIFVIGHVLNRSFYISKSFIQFCRSHPSLERVRLNKRPCEVSELYSIVNWAKIPAIKVLSLHSRIIYASDYLQNSWKRNRAERALCMLLTAYPSLEELEICPDFHESSESVTRYEVKVSVLIICYKHF